jgi:serine/threonine protein kinase
MGRVFLAEDQKMRRPVALKQFILNGSAETPADACARAIREARAAARVNHVGAVRIYDLVEEDGRPWIVMEPLPGRTLEEVLNAEGPMPAGQVTRIGLRLLDVLEATHRVGVVHCDVKPGNVHLCDSRGVVLADFGIARIIGEDSGSPAGEFAGSPAYVAPERINGGEFGPACDLFSLGATLFAAVEGRSPFDKGSLFDTLNAVVGDAPAPFLRAGPLRAIIEGLLAKEPDRRLNVVQARTVLQAVQRERPTCT